MYNGNQQNEKCFPCDISNDNRETLSLYEYEYECVCMCF